MGRLDGKVAVITGSSGGIGAATSERFAAEGATVVGVDLIGDADFTVDVADEAAVRDIYAQVRERHGRIDVLFNNAGISPNADASAVDTDLEVWRLVQEVNLTSVFLCCKHGIPHLLENPAPRRGSVINTSALVATLGRPPPHTPPAVVVGPAGPRHLAHPQRRIEGGGPRDVAEAGGAVRPPRPARQ